MENARILVVDDNEATRYALSLWLRNAGHEVVEVTTGKECLDLVLAGSVDLVVLDIKLPDMSGIEVCRRIKNHPETALIPVLQTSAILTESADRIEGFESGADGYLVPPLAQREVLARVETLLRVRRAEERLRQTIELNPQIPWAAKPDGLLEDFNERWVKLTGNSRQDLLGKSWFKVAHPEDLPRIEAAWSHALKSGDPCDIEHRIMTADGTYRWMRTQAFPHRTRDGGIVRWYGFTEDIHKRVEAEQALQHSERRYRQLFESMTEGFLLIEMVCDAARRPVSYRCLDANPAVELLARIKREDIIGKDAREVLGAVGKNWVEAFAGVALTGEPMHMEEYSNSLGAWFNVHAYCPEPGKVALICRNVTARRRAEEALHEGNQRLQYHTRNTPLAVIEFDSELRVSAWNEGAQRVFGWEAHEVLGRSMWEIPWIYREDQNIVTEVAAGLETGKTSQSVSPNRNLRKDGKVVWCVWYNSSLTDASGKMQSIQSLVLDVTATKEAHEALRESEARFRAMADGLPLIIWVHDAQGRQQFVNRTFCEFFGVQPHEMTGEKWLEFLHPDDAPGYQREFLASIQQRRPFHAEVRARRSDGEWRWIESFARPRISESGEFLGMVGTSPDITERRKAEVVLARSKNELEHMVAQRTAKLHELVGELEHLSYSITHDMRAPLRAMRAFAEAAQELCPEGPEGQQRNFLQRIMTAAERMDGLIADALSYTKAVRTELPLGPVDVARLIRGMLDSYPELFSADAEILVDGELPLVMGNEAALTQCFSNLLENAVKFTAPGTKATVRVWGELRDGWVRLWVEDNGIGISSAMLPRVFDMFARGSDSRAGTGIGLALVRKVVDRMGGRVGVHSEQGKGSRFWVELRPGDVRSAPQTG